MMPIPTYKDYYPYILKHADEDKSADEYLELIMKDMGVSDKKQSIRNSSGEPTVRNRLRWGIHYLRHAKLMDKPSRGRYVITERGRKIRKERGLDITNKTLMEFDEFREFKKPTKVTDEVSTKEKIEELTPIESLESLSNIIKSEVKSELRNQIFSLSPYFFEKLVVDLLKKMGYGSYQGTRVTSKSGDGGIDGIVYQDVLGLDIVYIQAKRYKEGSNIGSADLQKFSGALSGLKATKGIFFTTSDFTPSANKFLNTTPQNIVTVNGDRLLDLLIKYEVGVEVMTSHNTFKVNEDYFSE
jgi:restriction system protein